MSPLAPVRIALLNNMPDAALKPTEQQFRALLASVLPGRTVELLLFTLPEVARGAAALSWMEGRYAPCDRLFDAAPDALPDAMIVTGMECNAASLHATPFWASLARVIDGAAARALPTMWSCLAAHAAVLHLHGIERRLLPAKLSGVYGCAATGAAHDYAAGLPPAWFTPHSRYNDLSEVALRAHGYRILSRGAQVGVDAFACAQLPFLFLQGHPEYDPRALLREFARDFGRAAQGLAVYPAVPAGLLEPQSHAAMAGLVQQGEGGAGGAAMLNALRTVMLSARVRGYQVPGQPSLFGNWASAACGQAIPADGGCERLAS